MTALDCTAPQVIVDGIGVVVSALGNRDAVLVSIGDLVRTALEVPLAHRSDDLEVGIESQHACLKTNLVVALARAAMSSVRGTVLVGNLNELGGEQRARKGAQQRVFVFIHGVSSDGMSEVLIGELIAKVEYLAVENAKAQSLLTLLLKIGLLLTDVSAHADNVEVLLGLQPFDADGGVKTAGISQYYLFLAHVCFLSPLIAIGATNMSASRSKTRGTCYSSFSAFSARDMNKFAQKRILPVSTKRSTCHASETIPSVMNIT